MFVEPEFIDKHYNETGSKPAKRILDDWDTEKLKVTNNVKADLQVGRDYREGWKPKAII